LKQLQGQINSLASSKHSAQASSVIQELRSTLRISNEQTKYVLNFGPQYESMLEPRDRVLEHSFSFQEEFESEDIVEGSLINSSLYKAILAKIKLFMVEAISNVISIAFKNLCKGDLEGKEAKEYAAKNIMLNFHSIFRQTIAAFEEHEGLKTANVDAVKDDLVIQMDNILKNILINLADSYPQAPASGGTPRMREAITEVNRTDDEENDFIFTAGIKISEHLTIEIIKEDERDVEILKLEESGDYTSFIMKVLNAAINVTQDNKDDARERTIFERFSEFNEHLFWLAEQRDYTKIISTINEESTEEGSERFQKQAKISHICNYFDTIFGNSVLKNQAQKFQRADGLVELKKLR
jgi:hypothetical protein